MCLGAVLLEPTWSYYPPIMNQVCFVVQHERCYETDSAAHPCWRDQTGVNCAILKSISLQLCHFLDSVWSLMRIHILGKQIGVFPIWSLFLGVLLFVLRWPLFSSCRRLQQHGWCMRIRLKNHSGCRCVPEAAAAVSVKARSSSSWRMVFTVI